jgi:hypothetical protein
MQEADQASGHSTVADPLESVAPSVSLLDSILLLLTPEQRQHFLESAGIEGVVYANRAPTFDKPIAIKINKARFRDLLEHIGCPAREIAPRQWECNYDDPDPLAILKRDLEAGVRVSPPPRDWFGNHPEGDDVPIRIESRRFGIPCRVRPHVYGGSAYLEATALEPSDFCRSSEPSNVEDAESAEEVLDDPVDVEQLSSAVTPVTAEASSPSTREFTPHILTNWDVLGPNSRLSPEFDRTALGRLVSQLVANGRHSALSRATRERCEMLEGLVRLKQFASQYPYTLASQTGDAFEFQAQGPPEALTGMKRAYVYRDVDDGSRRDRVAGILLERIGRRNQCQLFRIPDGYQCDAPPTTGYLVDTGDISQLQKQLDALRELRHPSSRPHLLQLGTLLSSDNDGLGEPVSWNTVPIRLVDDKLTERQAEAVCKALASPDICLIQGPPGTGKTRVISEIVRQAARKNWKVLLVAPTHVAVDNVLERIGIQEDVSPVRCVRQAKLEDLPEHIQEFTYEKRSGLLANETGRRSEADRSTWQIRTKRLASAVVDLKQFAEHRVTADQMEHEIRELRAAHSRVSVGVEAEFVGETKRAADAAQFALESQSAMDKVLKGRRYELSLRVNRVAALNARQYTIEDHQQLNQSEAVVQQEHTPAIEAATTDRNGTSAAITEITALEADRQTSLAAARKILALLDQAEVPSTVQGVVDAAVADTTAQQDKIVATRMASLERAKGECAEVQRSIADLDLKLKNVTARARSLEEAQAKALPLRLFNGSWWRSFFTNYEQTASQTSKHSSELQQRYPALQARIREEERSLEEAQAKRLVAIEATRNQALVQQHDYYREAAARLPIELETIYSNHLTLAEKLQAQLVGLGNLRDVCRQEIEKARATTHARLLNSAQSDLNAARSAMENAETQLTEAQQQLNEAMAQVTFVSDRIRQTVESRTLEVTRAIEAKEFELTAVRERFARTIASLTDVLPTPPAFDAVKIDAALRQLTVEHEQAQRYLLLLEEWTQFLSRESENLKDRLAQYVNLVCATTVGIATDEYFGDKGPFVEKQFDLLVVDEAGKVTEPELLVAAVRAKRWVLVGDHKQLPPYYDKILDPYLRSANESRIAADQQPLDAQSLRLSIFERLWRRLNPDELQAAPDTEPTLAVSSDQDSVIDDPSVSRNGAFDEAEQSAMMWRERQMAQAWEDKRRKEQLDEMWMLQRVGRDGNLPQSLRGKQPKVDTPKPESAGESRCVTLDLQRRMHPDLAVFVSEMFYGGRYYSPDGDAYLQSKTLDLVHFPKPVTFIDVCPGKGADGYEVDLSNRDQRKKHLAEHDVELPERGYANLREAEQVIQVLEAIANDAALQREHAELEQAADQVPLVGIIALYAGQVALIHRLIRLSGTLRGERVSGSDWLCGGMRISVNSVDAFQGKECPIIILSFTRSNRRQAVGFVDDPNRLNVALSRARKKLVLVGDTETLTRRTRERPDGNNDNRAAKKERDFFVQLIRYIEGRGKTMKVFERRSAS